jgi:hypothetical protein
VTRPARNRLLIACFWVGFLVLGNVLWPPLRVPAVLLLLALSLASFIVSRDFFVGRRAMRRKAWVDALMAFERFEAQLESPARRRLSWLASGLYSFDAAAIARNNCGVVHLENGRLDLAEASFHAALARDALYAVPHLNLAVVAAKRGSAAVMEQHLAEGKRLGLSNRRAHAKVRAALQVLNEAAAR